jgi:hypothetical protein
MHSKETLKCAALQQGFWRAVLIEMDSKNKDWHEIG